MSGATSRDPTAGDRLRELTAWARGRADAAAATLAGPPGVVLVVATAVVFHGLGRRPLWWYDESFYANAARHAADHGFWLVPRLAGFDTIHPSPFLEKPPLAIWLEALSIAALGPTEFAVRLPSAAAAVGAAVLVYAVGRRVGGPAAGVVAAAAFLTTPAVLVGPNGARFGATDTLHTLFGSLVVSLLWLHATDRRDVSPLLLGGVGAALLLTKGFAAGVFALAVAPLFVARPGQFSPRFVAVSSLAAAVPAGAWAGAAYLLEGRYFVREIFVEQVLDRIAGQKVPVEYETVVPLLKYPYLTEVQAWFRPWWFLFLAGAVVAAGTRYLADGADDRPPDVAFMLWWAAAVLVPFALTGTRSWYVMPMYVPAAVVVGWLVASAVDGRPAAMAGVAAGTLLAAVAGSDHLLYAPGSGGGVAVRPHLPPDWTVVLAVAVLCAGGWLLHADVAPRNRLSLRNGWSLDLRSLARLATTGLVLVLVVGVLVGAPSVYGMGYGGVDPETDAAFRHLGERTAAAVPEGAVVYVDPNAAARWHYASYGFYADRPMRGATVEELRTDPSVTYALLRRGGVPLVDHRDPRTVAASPTLDVVLVRLGPPPEETDAGTDTAPGA